MSLKRNFRFFNDSCYLEVGTELDIKHLRLRSSCCRLRYMKVKQAVSTELLQSDPFRPKLNEMLQTQTEVLALGPFLFGGKRGKLCEKKHSGSEQPHC